MKEKKKEELLVKYTCYGSRNLVKCNTRTALWAGQAFLAKIQSWCTYIYISLAMYLCMRTHRISCITTFRAFSLSLSLFLSTSYITLVKYAFAPLFYKGLAAYNCTLAYTISDLSFLPQQLTCLFCNCAISYYLLIQFALEMTI